MSDKSDLLQQLKINWKSRLLLGFGGFGLSLFLYLVVFQSDVVFALYMSFMLGFFQTIFFQAGIDSYYIKKHFEDYDFITTTYFRRYLLFFYSKLIIDKECLTIITSKWNAKSNIIQLNLEDIQSFEKIKYLGFLNNGLKLKADSQSEIRLWVSNIDDLLKVLKKTHQANQAIS